MNRKPAIAMRPRGCLLAGMILFGSGLAFVLYFRSELVRHVAGFAVSHVNDALQIERSEYQRRWFGVPVLQYANDLIFYQELFWEVKPDVVIETGTFSGGLSIYFSTLLDHINPSAKVISVDLHPSRWETTLRSFEGPRHLLDRIVFLEGDSVSAAIIDRIAELIPDDAVVVVLLDSHHTRAHVLRELELYGRFVTPGSYLIVTDTHLDRTQWTEGGPGPMAAVHEFTRTTDRFIIDRSRNEFLVGTAVRNGYLKRIR